MNTTTQPKWKCIANLGDASPLEYGGYFVYVDETGVYPPEAELLVTPEEDEETGFEVYRFILDRCTYQNGVLSNNPFHPDYPAWFAGTAQEKVERPQDTTYLSNIAEFTGQSEESLIEDFCSDDPINRAHAYRAVGEYHGFHNLDDYPLQLTKTEVYRMFDENGRRQ